MQFLAEEAKERGFTLIEIIMVIVLLGIIGAMGAETISTFFRGFADSEARQELFEEGKLAMMRLERDLHHAIPNAIQVSGTGNITIEFGKIDVMAADTNGNDITGQYAHDTTTAISNDIFDQYNSGCLPTGTIISIYNTSWNTFAGPARRLFRTSCVAAPIMTLSDDSGSSRPITTDSPYQRYFPVHSVIRYHFDASSNSLLRSEIDATVNGNFSTALNNATAMPLVSNIDFSNPAAPPSFSYNAGTLANNGIITIAFTLRRSNNQVAFHKEIQVRNVP